jgi:hypothetical protein
MKQKSLTVSLLEFTCDDRPFGNPEGKEVFRKLSDFVDQHPAIKIFGISFNGIVATDASFARESVISLAKQLRGERAFFLTELTNRDLIDNWCYAARAKEQPLIIWDNDSFELIGPELSKANRELVEYVLQKGDVLASQAASDLNISIPNASTRLKRLVSDGYLLRLEDVADSGGIEFMYSAIR